MFNERIAEGLMEGEKFLTMKEVGDLIGVDRSTVYNWKRRGLLPHYKIGGRAVRFKLVEVLQWLETQKREANRDDKGVRCEPNNRRKK